MPWLNIIFYQFFRTLDCGNHFCSKLCHPGPCESCAYLPENVEFCPCKQTRLTNLLSPDERRQSCLDPVPCCDNFCGKKLQCGSPGKISYVVFAFLCRKKNDDIPNEDTKTLDFECLIVELNVWFDACLV